MTPRRLPALCAVLLASSALARPASADDAQAAAAAAAAQAVGGMASGGASPGVAAAVAGGAGKSNGPSAGGHFSRALSAPTIQRTAAPGKKLKGAKGGKSAASKNGPESKYKSRELVENSEHSYRFDENGNPKNASAAPKKKLSAKSAKKSSTASDDKDEKPGACSTDEPCTVKNSDADAL